MKSFCVFLSAISVASAGFNIFRGGFISDALNSIGGHAGGYESGRNDNGLFRNFGQPNQNNFDSFPNYGNSETFDSNHLNSDSSDVGQIKRFISVHVAPPEEPLSTEPKIVRVGGPPDTHYNIIFIKAPTISEQPTEIILPEQPVHKSIVYVLVKKTEPEDNLRIRAPAPTQPSKPEVYFIRYKNPNGIPPNGIGNENEGAGGAIPVRDFDSPSESSGFSTNSISGAYGSP